MALSFVKFDTMMLRLQHVHCCDFIIVTGYSSTADMTAHSLVHMFTVFTLNHSFYLVYTCSFVFLLWLNALIVYVNHRLHLYNETHSLLSIFTTSTILVFFVVNYIDMKEEYT